MPTNDPNDVSDMPMNTPRQAAPPQPAYMPGGTDDVTDMPMNAPRSGSGSATAYTLTNEPTRSAQLARTTKFLPAMIEDVGPEVMEDVRRGRELMGAQAPAGAGLLERAKTTGKHALGALTYGDIPFAAGRAFIGHGLAALEHAGRSIVDPQWAAYDVPSTLEHPVKPGNVTVRNKQDTVAAPVEMSGIARALTEDPNQTIKRALGLAKQPADKQYYQPSGLYEQVGRPSFEALNMAAALPRGGLARSLKELTTVPEQGAKALIPLTVPGRVRSEQIAEATSGLFDQLHKAGIELNPAKTAGWADDIAGTIATERSLAWNMGAKKVAGLVEALRNPFGTGPPRTWDEIQKISSLLGEAGKSADNEERAAAWLAKHRLWELLEGLDDADLNFTNSTMNKQKALDMINKARPSWAAAKHMEVYENALEHAANAGNANFAEKLTGEAEKILNSRKLSYGLPKDEMDMLRQISRVGPMQKGLRFVGKMAPSAETPTTSMGAAAFAAGLHALWTGLEDLRSTGLAAFAPSIAGVPSKIAANAMEQARWRRLIESAAQKAPVLGEEQAKRWRRPDWSAIQQAIALAHQGTNAVVAPGSESGSPRR